MARKKVSFAPSPMLMLQPATSCGTISRSVSRTQRGRMHRMVSSPPASRVTLRSSCRQADEVHIIDYCRSFRVCNTVYDVVSCGRCTFSSSHVWMRFASTRHSGKGLCGTANCTNGKTKLLPSTCYANRPLATLFR